MRQLQKPEGNKSGNTRIKWMISRKKAQGQRCASDLEGTEAHPGAQENSVNVQAGAFPSLLRCI